MRDRSIDIARGIAIIAIVLGHVLRGLAAAGIIDAGDPGALAIDRSLYLFHLSSFAFLAGLFVQTSIHKAGAGTYARARITQFVYLYALWSLLQGGVKLATSQLVNGPVTLSEVLNFAHPDGQLWFLPWLVLVTALIAIVRPWRNRPLAVTSIMVAAGVSIAAWGSDPGIAGLQGVGLITFFFTGALCGSQRVSAYLRQLTPIIACCTATILVALFLAIVLLTPATPPTAYGDERTVLSVVAGIVGSTIGVAALLAVARVLSFSAVATRVLGFVGQRSLEVFLASITFASGTRIVLTRFDVDDPLVHAILGTLAGIVGPLVVWWVMTRYRQLWLFNAPRWLLGARTRHQAERTVSPVRSKSTVDAHSSPPGGAR